MAWGIAYTREVFIRPHSNRLPVRGLRKATLDRTLEDTCRVDAFIIAALGSAHLVLTFRGVKLHPRDGTLEERIRSVSPIITNETTMWDAWIGFNASHSFGAILFGLIGFLVLRHGGFLFHSLYILAVGLVFLAGYLFLGFRYWFSVPRRGIALATLLYVAAIVVSRV